MTPELERVVKRYRQWFGSYKRSCELVKVQVWLTKAYAIRVAFLSFKTDGWAIRMQSRQQQNGHNYV